MLKGAVSESEASADTSELPSFASLLRHQQCVFRRTNAALKASVLRCWNRKAIVMIDCGHMWRLWSGYIAAQNGISRIFTDPPPLSHNKCLVFPLLCICQWTQHFNHNSVLLVTCGCRGIILCCYYIVYSGGQSCVCTPFFRWWFTYILSSWVIEWLSHFPGMKKVTV